MSYPLYTIGHSSHHLDHFLHLVLKYSISAVCDVRSSPYSGRNPQFNRETLKQSLAAHDLAYVFLGHELGARSSDASCYDEQGRVCYDRLARTDVFKRGLERLHKGMGTHMIALMCAEGDPIECHRAILVCRHLRSSAAIIRHILADGNTEAHAHTEQRLLGQLRMRQGELFSSDAEILERAYDVQGERIAYIKPAVQLSAPIESTD